MFRDIILENGERPIENGLVEKGLIIKFMEYQNFKEIGKDGITGLCRVIFLPNINFIDITIDYINEYLSKEQK